MTTTHTSGLEVRRWTRAEYDQLIEHGLLQPEERVELVDGEILRMAPQNTPHSVSLPLVYEALRAAFPSTYHVRPQSPLALDRMSEPEPDFAVVSGVPRQYLQEHPSSAALVVEIADTSLPFDRGWKASLYARAGIPEYWIVNLPDRLLEVHRDPVEQATARYGWGYASVERHDPSATVTPLAAPRARIAVADLLP